jgi:hypothetical protein
VLSDISWEVKCGLYDPRTVRPRALCLVPLVVAFQFLAVGQAVAQRASSSALLCEKPPPPGSVSIALLGSKGILGTFRIAGCGPRGSYSTLTLTPNARDDVFHVVVRPGTCSTASPGPWYTLGFNGVSRDWAGDWFATPPIPIDTLAQSAFAVELVLPGATTASACGSHRGTQHLPAARSARIDSGYGVARRVSRSRLILPINSKRATMMWAAITPSQDGARSTVAVHGESLGSTVAHMRLRRGKCSQTRPLLDREIVLQPFGSDQDGAKTTSTTMVQVPFAILSAGGWAIELLGSSTFESTPFACGQIGPR